MKRMLLIPLLLLGILWAQSGCAASSLLTSEANRFLGPGPDFDSMRSFRALLEKNPGTAEYERDRINYLLERVSGSPYNFIRNASRYTGKRAGIHLRWKYFFRTKKKLKTAEEFIQISATRSRRSGHPYLIEFPDRKRSPLGVLLTRELRCLDEELGRRQARKIEKQHETKIQTAE